MRKGPSRPVLYKLSNIGSVASRLRSSEEAGEASEVGEASKVDEASEAGDAARRVKVDETDCK